MGEFSTPARLVKTRKEHHCCCFSLYVNSNYSIQDVPYEYRDALHRMRELGGKIPSGSECYYWSGRYDGGFFHAYADIEIYNLVKEMEWFDL